MNVFLDDFQTTTISHLAGSANAFDIPLSASALQAIKSQLNDGDHTYLTISSAAAREVVRCTNEKGQLAFTRGVSGVAVAFPTGSCVSGEVTSYGLEDMSCSLLEMAYRIRIGDVDMTTDKEIIIGRKGDAGYNGKSIVQFKETKRENTADGIKVSYKAIYDNGKSPDDKYTPTISITIPYPAKPQAPSVFSELVIRPQGVAGDFVNFAAVPKVYDPNTNQTAELSEQMLRIPKPKDGERAPTIKAVERNRFYMRDGARWGEYALCLSNGEKIPFQLPLEEPAKPDSLKLLQLSQRQKGNTISFSFTPYLSSGERLPTTDEMNFDIPEAPLSVQEQWEQANKERVKPFKSGKSYYEGDIIKTADGGYYQALGTVSAAPPAKDWRRVWDWEFGTLAFQNKLRPDQLPTEIELAKLDAANQWLMPQTFARGTTINGAVVMPEVNRALGAGSESYLADTIKGYVAKEIEKLGKK